MKGDLPLADAGGSFHISRVFDKILTMAYKCDYCGKGVQYGGTGTHHPGVAGAQWKKRAQRTRKVFKPNLHVARVQVAGDFVKMRLCTKCLRKLKTPKVKDKSGERVVAVI